MGGNALSTKSVRLDKLNYDLMATFCLAKLRELYPQGRFEAVESYRSKPDHGDLDLLVSAPDYDPHKAAEALGALEVVRNGPVTSVGLRVPGSNGAAPLSPEGAMFQVDLIKTSAVEFDYTSRYFKWNDLGNLVGRVAHKGATSHRHDGLYFYVRDPESPDHKFRELLLTRDHDKALAYLGYDASRFNEGFDTLDAVLEYVATTEFFNRNIYLLENRNAAARVRDRKRPTYTKFLQWCEAHPELPAFEYPEDKAVWLPRMAEHFPHFQGEYDQALADLAELRSVKAKFNGELVAQWTGLAGKELGAVMQRFKESFETSAEQRAFVLNNSQETLAVRVQGLQAAMTP
jgi:hypothetical protein